MTDITSTSNPRVREVVALQRGRGRRETGRHLVEGPNAVAEALAADLVEQVFVTESAASFVPPTGGSVTLVSDHVMQRMSDARTPQGVVAVARTRTAGLTDVVGAGLLVVLLEVADPGNAGTVLRTADAAGATAVVATSGSADLFSPKCVRAAAGSTYHLPLVVEVSVDEVLDACRRADQPVMALDGGGDRSVFDLETPSGPLALILGNEAHGIPDALRTQVDGVVAVPLHGRAESLNVAAAAAVAIYAAARGLHPSG